MFQFLAHGNKDNKKEMQMHLNFYFWIYYNFDTQEIK